jgi:hypothetical protein
MGGSRTTYMLIRLIYCQCIVVFIVIDHEITFTVKPVPGRRGVFICVDAVSSDFHSARFVIHEL